MVREALEDLTGENIAEPGWGSEPGDRDSRMLGRMHCRTVRRLQRLPGLRWHWHMYSSVPISIGLHLWLKRSVPVSLYQQQRARVSDQMELEVASVQQASRLLSDHRSVKELLRLWLVECIGRQHRSSLLTLGSIRKYQELEAWERRVSRLPVKHTAGGTSL